VKPELGLRVVANRMPVGISWLIGAAFVAMFLVRDYLMSSHGVIDHAVYWGRDFINVWTGGHLVREGRFSTLYDLQAYSAYQRSLFGQIGQHNYSYPPVSYPLAAAFSLLPYWLSLTAWLAGTGAVFVLACQRWWPSSAGPVWLAALTPAAIVNIWAGHYGFLVGALFLFGWRSLDDNPRRAGVLFGLMLIKPHLAVLVPIVLLIRREWTALASGAATVAALIGGTILGFGWQPWADFVFRTSGVQTSMIDAGDMFFRLMSTSTATALLQYHLGWTVAMVGQGFVALCGIGMVSLAALWRMPTRRLAFLTATCTFLVLPYAFNYDLTVVCVGALALLYSPQVQDDDYRLGWYGFLAPQLGMVTAAFLVFLMPVMLLGLAVAQFRCWGLRRWPRKPAGTGDILAKLWPQQAAAPTVRGAIQPVSRQG